MNYRFNDRHKTLAFDMYPEVSLADARKRRAEARTLIQQGVDPAETKKAQKTARETNAANSFEVIAREWFSKFSMN